AMVGRVVCGSHREALLRSAGRRPFRNCPWHQYAVTLQAQVVVQAGSRMLLNDEHERPTPPLDWHGSRLRCSFESALGGVFAELVFDHGEILGEMPCGCWLARAATPTRSGKEISIRRTSNRMPCWPGTPNACRASRSITPSTEC